MHTTHIGKVAFVHNGDHSGDVHIVLPDTDPLRPREIVVPMAALVDFVGGAIRDQVIAELEQLSGREVVTKFLSVGKKKFR